MCSESRRVLVTGGAGFIGSHVADALAARGNPVRVLDSLVTGNRDNLAKSPIEFYAGDIRCQKDVDAALDGIEWIVHLAGLRSVSRSQENPDMIRDVNVGGTKTLLACAEKKGVRRMVVASSVLVYGNTRYPQKEDQALAPASPYGESKAAAEKVCLQHRGRLECLVLRCFNVYGPRQDPASKYAAVVPEFISRLLSDKPCVIYGDGKQTRDFIFIDDAVRATLAACDVQGLDRKVINIGSGRETSILEIYGMLQTIMKKNIAPEFLDQRKGDMPRSLADPALCRRLLAMPACIGMEQGLRRTVDWHLARQSVRPTGPGSE